MNLILQRTSREGIRSATGHDCSLRNRGRGANGQTVFVPEPSYKLTLRPFVSDMLTSG
jgi:hypothetical protein